MAILPEDTQERGYVLKAAPDMPPYPRDGIDAEKMLEWMQKIHRMLQDTFSRQSDRIENMDMVGEWDSTAGLDRPDPEAHRQRYWADDTQQEFIDVWNGTTAVWRQVYTERGIETTDVKGFATMTFVSAERYRVADGVPCVLITAYKSGSVSFTCFAFIESFSTAVSGGVNYYTGFDVYVYDDTGMPCDAVEVIWTVAEPMP